MRLKVWQAVGRGVHDWVRRWRERIIALQHLPSTSFSSQFNKENPSLHLHEDCLAFSADKEHHPRYFGLLPTNRRGPDGEKWDEEEDEEGQSNSQPGNDPELSLLHVEQFMSNVQDCAIFLKQALTQVSSPNQNGEVCAVTLIPFLVSK